MRHCHGARPPGFGRVARAVGVAAALLLVGCGPTVLPLTDYADATGIDPTAAESGWGPLATGQYLVLAAADGGCEATVGASFEELEQGGQPVSTRLGSQRALLLQVEDALVVAASEGVDGWVALEVHDEKGSSSWLRLTPGAEMKCLRPVTAEAVAMSREAARRAVFVPSKPACVRIEATGTAPSAALLESEAGVPMQTSGVTFAPAGPSASSEFVPWMTFNNGTLAVRFDTYRSCFAPSAPAAAPGGRASALLHIDPDRCETSTEAGATHLRCASTLGVWEGVVDGSRVSIELRRRTLGTIHFLDERPVKSGRWARAVVSVSTGKPSDARSAALYDAVERSVAERLGAAEGSVRVAAADDPTLTYRTRIEVENVRIGPLERTTVTESTRYKSGERDVPNPAKGQARARVTQARDRLAQAQRDYETAQQTWAAAVLAAQQAKELCLSQCSMMSDPMAASSCQTNCEIAGGVGDVVGVLTQPTDADVVAARNELSGAEQTEQSTPETIREDIMSPWQYEKEIFARSVSASLRVTMQPVGGQPTTEELPLSHRWEDFRVEGDAAHNVEGHQPERGPIDREEALLPLVARLAGERAAKAVEVALARAALEDLRQRFAATGQQSKPGFEDVNAMAFDVAGARLLRVVQQGSAELAGNGTPVALPSAAVSLGVGECMLAVAVSEGASEPISLAALGGHYGDFRKKPYAFIEACGSELPAAARTVPDLSLESRAGAKARWALYLTRERIAPAASATP